MFELLQKQPPDPLLALIKQFRDDPRSEKLDLGVGVYRDPSGETPVFTAIKKAERILLETQPTKAYLGPEGDLRFVELLQPIVFGAGGGERIVGIQTPGGSGALRLAAELAHAAKPGARIWVGQPSWPNHAPIFSAAGLEVAAFPQFDIRRQALLFDEMLEVLSRAERGDVVLLHGCCHNPTGADPDLAQWEEVATIIADRGLFPLIDLAYQGLGERLEADAAGTRRVIARAEQALVAYSCDKNFGVYRERTGAVFAIARDAGQAEVARSNLAALARVNWSMPPDHGAAAVRVILESEELSAEWRTELEGMCRRINEVRAALAKAEPSLGFLTRQRGLFANLDLTKEAVARLRAEHGVYMAGSGRINIAGLQVKDAERFVGALRSVSGRAGAELDKAS